MILQSYTFCYDMLLIFYILLSHIYNPVWLVIIFEYLLYFILSIVWFQSSDSISAIHLYFKFILRKNNPLCTDPQLFWQCKCFFVTVTIGVNSTQPTTPYVIFPCVFFSANFDEDGNEIIIFSLAGYIVSVDLVFDKVGIDDQHMGLIFVIWSLMIFDEHK